MPTTLAIETSCDDTCLSLVSEDQWHFWVDKHRQYSQTKEHAQYGWVVPEIASRGHARTIIEQVAQIGDDVLSSVDSISVTIKPGLPWSLAVGRATANFLASWYEKPLILVNHIHGHLLSILLDRSIDDLQFPLAILSISGGHNDLYLLTENSLDNTSEPVWPRRATRKGKTLDDAVWEAFDKTARHLGWPYPGGKRLSDLATQDTGDYQVPLKASFLNKESYDFSFSGIKSQVHRYVTQNTPLNDQHKSAIAHAFQEAVCHVLSKKLVTLAENYQCRQLALVGGVSANTRLREAIAERSKKELLVPKEFLYCTDNAAMIGCVALTQT